jgi:O-6-methylguanine DNA methyltransferase
MLHYTIFRTKWGYFGLAGTEAAVSRTFLPAPERQDAERGLLKSLQPAGDNLSFHKDFQQDLQKRIIAYYEGEPVDFSTDPALSLSGSSPFVHKVLNACRKISYGHTRTYRDLAREVGSPNAARAVGGVMAGNPVPLIIPCHRVVRSDGLLGGFGGGMKMKEELLSKEGVALDKTGKVSLSSD